jgi:hypothetical protein
MAVNVGFATTLLVAVPSYYFCFRRRENKERMIELMMNANDFEPAEDMPEEPSITEDHPFLQEASSKGDATKPLEYKAYLKEKKEWQEPTPTRDKIKDVFSPKPK